MKRVILIVAIAAMGGALGGCLSTVATVATAPVKVAAKGVDWATTSRDEADRNRGRKIRKAEQRARNACRKQYDDDYDRDMCVRESMRNEGY